jgi:hypothetical protein
MVRIRIFMKGSVYKGCIEAVLEQIQFSKFVPFLLKNFPTNMALNSCKCLINVEVNNDE